MDSVTDRAERPHGLLASLSDFWARVRAEAPKHVAVVHEQSLLTGSHVRTRDLALSETVVRYIKSAPSKTVGPPNPIATLPSGYEYRAIPAVEWARRAEIVEAVGSPYREEKRVTNGLDPDVAALAWCLASEAPDIRRYPAYSVAIAEAVINSAIKMPAMLVRRVCADTRLPGLYLGRQSGRWCSSFQPPTQKHVKCAELVLARARAGMPNLLASGATHWVDCDVQVRMHAKKPATNPSPENVMNRRYRSNLAWVGPIVSATGEAIIDPWKLCLLGPKGVSREEAYSMLSDGRRRWKRPA